MWIKKRDYERIIERLEYLEKRVSRIEEDTRFYPDSGELVRNSIGNLGVGQVMQAIIVALDLKWRPTTLSPGAFEKREP